MASLEMGVLKEQIHQKLKDDGVLSSLKAIVSSVLSSSGGGGGGASTEGAAAIAVAQHKSVLAQLVAHEAAASNRGGNRGATNSSSAATSESKMLLHVLLLGGRAFTTQAEAGPQANGSSEVTGSGSGSGSSSDSSGNSGNSGNADGNSGNNGHDQICVSLHFGSQRFRSAWVPLCAEPALGDGVVFEMPQPDEAALAAARGAALPGEAAAASRRWQATRST